MEVTPDIYAWLIDLNILEGNKSIKFKTDSNVLLPDEVVTSMSEGLFFDRILKSLEEGYNKFYKIKLSYTEQLKELKFKRGSSGRIEANLKFTNWKTIAEILNNFGLYCDSDKIRKISSGNKTELANVLNTIHTLMTELMRKSMGTTSHSLNNFDASINLDTMKKEKERPMKISQHDTVDLNNFNEKKDYSKCESPLEFLIVSICKVFEMKPRQAVALLSNNRKYLKHICNKGIKNSFDRVNEWFRELVTNSRTFTNLLRRCNNGRAVGLATVSVGLYSKNNHVAVNSFNLVAQMQVDLGTDWDWFVKEGIEAVLFCINKHVSMRINLLNLLSDFYKNNLSDLFNLLDSKLILEDSREKQLQFFSSVVGSIRDSDPNLYKRMKEYLFTNCLAEYKDISTSVSIVADAWIRFSPIDINTTNNIISYFKYAVREKSKKGSQSAAIIHLFRVMKHFAEIKKEEAPLIYKNLVFLFLEGYDHTNMRECILTQFAHFFKSDHSVPLKILLDPYIKMMKSSGNYDLSDFHFINEILNHPRIDSEDILNILDFILIVCSGNFFYSRTAGRILTLILDMKLPYIEDEEFTSLFVSHIQGCLGNFTENLKTRMIDVNLLESPFFIVSMNMPYINKSVHKDIVDTASFYRIEFNQHSMGMLALLWFYDDHDDVLLNLEEKFADRNDPTSDNFTNDVSKNVNKGKPRDPKKDIEKIKSKKMKQQVHQYEEEYKNEVKEMKIKKSLMKQLEKKSLELGSFANSGIDSSALILQEGTLANPNVSNPVKKNKENPYKNFVPINLDDEEDRETRAIHGMIKEYNREIAFYFKTFVSDINNNVTKANVLKLFRELGFDDEQFSLEELTIATRNIFGSPLNMFTKEQFLHLIVQISYLIITKRNPLKTISECFREILLMFKVPKVKEKQKDVKKILTYLKEKMASNTSGNVTLPPGFKKVEKIAVNYDYKIPEQFTKFLPESKIICIEMLNDIIQKSFETSIIEPRVKINKEFDVKIDPNNARHLRWSKGILQSLTSLTKDVEKEAIDTADLMEDMLKALDKGRTTVEKEKYLTPVDKFILEQRDIYHKEEAQREKNRQLRIQFVKKDLVVKKQKKKEEKEKTEKEEHSRKEVREGKLKERKQKEKQERKIYYKEVKKEYDEKMEKEKEKEKRAKERKIKMKQQKAEEWKEFSEKQKTKLKEQFIKVRTIKEEYEKLQRSYFEQPMNLPKVKKKFTFSRKNPPPLYLFEKNLNKTMADALEKPELKEVFSQYENHIKTLFDIYSKMSRRLGPFLDENIHFNQFKEFCINFTILGLLINNDQMHYIFHKLCKQNDGEGEEQNFLRYKDFAVSLLYICIICKFTVKSRKILPSDLEKTDGKALQMFLDFLGLKLPFNKRELEEFVNDRRALSAKALLKLQETYRREKVPAIKPQKMKRKVFLNKINKLTSVEENDLKNSANTKLNVIDPSGKNEEWKVKDKDKKP